MRKQKLLTKIITPIVLIGIVFSYLGFLYLNTMVETTIKQEISEKLDSKVNNTIDNMEYEFKLLFQLYGKSSGDYFAQEKISKAMVLNQLKSNEKDSTNIVYVIEPNEYIKIGNKILTSSELAKLVRTNKDKVVIDETTYKVKQLYFKPWEWNIIYLLDTTSFKDILEKNKLVLLGIIYILLFILVVIVIITLNIYIKEPIDILLNHFSLITKGEYMDISNITYNTNEIDALIKDVNNMTKSIQYREEESEALLELTKKNESYMQDILSSQSSIIIINDKKEILDVNDSFLEFFHEYETINDFKKEHSCVCDFFIEEEGFVYKFKDKNWIEYILLNNELLHKVKILKDNKYYIYTIEAKKSEKYNRIILTMTDITELEKSNNLLKEYKKAVDAGTIVSKTDIKGKITYVNDKFINISGYTKDELINENHNMVSSPNTKKEIFKDMWKTIKSKKIWYGNIENRKKDGGSYFVAATIIPILDENDNIIEYMGLRYDITEQIQAVEKAKKAENTKSLFLANMSHEIRTPLNAIIGFTKILKNSKLDKKETSYINIVDSSAQNLLGIVNDILDISKIENGSLVCESIEFNPFKEFNSIIDLFLAKADEKNINIISNIDPKILHKIIGDPLRIKQVLSNLISNAIKFSHDNSDIVVDIKLIKQENNYCKIGFSVKDNGIGISKEKQNTIFDDFTQADDSTSREYGGTGLGLSISNKIVNALGSNIQIESEANQGSRFYFDLEYKNDEKNNKNMEELNKVKVGVVEFKEDYGYTQLFQYIDYLTLLTTYNNTDELKDITDLDLLYVYEDDIDENIKKIHNLNNTRIIVLSKSTQKCDKLENCEVLNIPFNRSALFDMLAEYIDKTDSSITNKTEQYTQFQGSILVAEDHLVNQQLISMLLELRGIKFEVASNGQEAVDLFEKNSYDLVLMDINMPIKNGKEATKEIIEYEQLKKLTHTPIVALTANVIETDKKETMEIGFDDYLLKPIDEIRIDEVFTRYLTMKKEVIIDSKIVEDTPVVQVDFNLEDISKKMGLPSVVVKKIVTSFTTTIDDDLWKLKDAIEKNNIDEVKDFSHKIKGASLNLRMENVSHWASSIEKQAIENINKTIEKDFESLEKEIKVVQESVL
ncbi:MAG: ATP-binding protein [Campylobacterota bacterium]|nr:ATP-binding protein [Campylobacterota bacterium]